MGIAHRGLISPIPRIAAIRVRDTSFAQFARNIDSVSCQNHLFFRPCLPGDCDNALPAIDLVVLLVLLLRKAADALRATDFDVVRLCAIGLFLMIGSGKRIDSPA